jgi:predicted nucleic acid-binding protein
MALVIDASVVAAWAFEEEQAAQSQALPLATLDRELARAAHAEQVALIGAEIH